METKKSIKLVKIQISKLNNQGLGKIRGGDGNVLKPKNQSRHGACETEEEV
ncbi:hypothetical protein [Aquimarina algiphila]|uniref:hypothetical protein n=1 Tax=Aquimarina algiphila TaxID=2047982 RepID=UPI00232E1223|nr:hypothetical protein [Aquimarina algiphila]